jgi:hypothetical protein
MLIIKNIFLLFTCFALLTGCAQTMKQHSSMLDAMNGKLTPINYNKTYIFSTFGYPYSKTASTSGGVTTETWIYKTNLGSKDLLFNKYPSNARYMKITLTNNLVTNVDFE